MDVSGPYPKTLSGNVYIVSFGDHFSGWPEEFSVPDKSAQTIAQLIYEEIFPRYGCPLQLVTDNGQVTTHKPMQKWKGFTGPCMILWLRRQEMICQPGIFFWTKRWLQLGSAWASLPSSHLSICCTPAMLFYPSTTSWGLEEDTWKLNRISSKSSTEYSLWCNNV